MSGGIAGRGRPGPAGPDGPMGPTGPKGDPAFTLAIGSVRGLPYGEQPEVTNVGTTQDQVWDLALVTGATGVLTGPLPPTGADGTSLGQLYYCTANQTYYGLVELNENDNKWRTIMTQENSRQRFTLELLAEDRPAAGVDGDIMAAGYISVIFDEVRQTCTAMIEANYGQPIGHDTWLLVDASAHAAIRAMANQRGIMSIPLQVGLQTNGVTTTTTVELLALQYGIVKNLGGTGQLDVDAEGNVVALKARLKDGVLQSQFLEAGAPAASEFGSYPTKLYEDGLSAALIKAIAKDQEYPVVLYAGASTTVMYDD